MLQRKNLPIVLLLFGAGLFLAFRSLGFGLGNGNPPTKYEKILHNVGEMLAEIHYSPKKIDDNFSKEIFKKYLGEKIDDQKNVLLQTDIQALKKYETKIDDEILGGPVQFVPAVSEIYKKRLPETEDIYKEILSKPFDFSKDESANFNDEKLDYPKNEADRKEAWRKRLKYMALERYYDLTEDREKNKGKENFVVKTDEQLEQEARDQVLKILNRNYERLKLKVSDDDRFNEFVKTITESMDPHTTFMPPVDKRYFDEEMSGRFYGIGASLREEDGNIKIGSVLAGSPALKSGEIGVGDAIIKVAQGAADPVDLSGYTVQDAVKLIRGKKGTEVRLTIKKTDGSVKTVTLIRDEIIQDETFARSAVINTPKGKLGFIYLPEFYADFDNPKGARCSEDVKKEIIKLKEQKVDGIIMDLRNNGGGSLYDVVQMVGLFIEGGPIVQVKDREGKPQVYYDRDKSVLYDGPLAVMVNEFSASASEIFAAAIQDYDRGVIIGSTSTYGKGTVQRNIGLDKTMGFLDPNSELGTIKLTLQKFYRINGGSTQLRGVASDVNIPDIFEYTKIREKDNPDALAWDEIQKADYTRWKYGLDLSPIRKASAERLKSNPLFTTIHNNAEWLAKQSDKTVSLSLKKYQEEQKKNKAIAKQIEGQNKLPHELNVDPLIEDMKRVEATGDVGKLDRFKKWLQILRNDPYLDEATNVLNDMVTQTNLVYANVNKN
ncbi:tail-specific protease [Niastella yeongjuensis]|uniref:Tail-specific protease n=1 Tax=Niastella yeongjuensis TaxID=354355 RepID=A0A1V9EUI1_9BACT|nr:carboxy terminal-processing peptidase [Niastella yeongjuensis]OQP49823.1 tail-specific protease [Niastella yeongjuensis]SEP40909.1 carboxyl-terminal processing protease [Niastella yeongjuensis]